uniref:Uncharacterized protein n=1 Tax=Utricularia reniformis TaxID=192314 RepID=A0A1Y0B2H6_9LAMI|nr:hypothetical protein AEK19_MT1406 [Utricularia reniformis]ART31601.1 hypothetical protein AEK19_MT1406 [Utricularia reniformis]
MVTIPDRATIAEILTNVSKLSLNDLISALQAVENWLAASTIVLNKYIALWLGTAIYGDGTQRFFIVKRLLMLLEFLI